MPKKNKCYAVVIGVQPGLYDNWPACQGNIKGYPKAKFKSFQSESKAEKYYFDLKGSKPRKFYGSNLSNNGNKTITPLKSPLEYIRKGVEQTKVFHSLTNEDISKILRDLAAEYDELQLESLG